MANAHHNTSDSSECRLGTQPQTQFAQVKMTDAPNVFTNKPDCEAVGATGTSTFNELPPELFELIAEHSDNAALRALRLTCRDFAAKVLRTYGQAHFTSRSLLLFNLDGIQTAVSAAEHPVFGSHLRQLVIVVDEVVAHPGCTACWSVFTTSKRTAELTRLFRFFVSRRMELQLKLTDHKARARDRIRCTPLKCTICNTEAYFSAPYVGWDAPWSQVLLAVRRAGVKISSMAIKSEAWMLEFSGESTLAPSRGLFLDALQGMRHLEVHVAALRDETDDEWGAFDFLSMISSAKTLETFKVRIEEGSGGDLESLIFGTTMPGIRHFSLTGGAYLEVSQLQSFIQRNPNLQRLDLCETTFTYGNFDQELLNQFEPVNQSDVPYLVQEFIDLPGEYEDLWSYDVYEIMRETRKADKWDHLNDFWASA